MSESKKKAEAIGPEELPDPLPPEEAAAQVSPEHPEPEPNPQPLPPGQYAEQKVGYSDAEPGSKEALEHAEKFNKAKAAQRFGH